MFGFRKSQADLFVIVETLLLEVTLEEEFFTSLLLEVMLEEESFTSLLLEVVLEDDPGAFSFITQRTERISSLLEHSPL